MKLLGRVRVAENKYGVSAALITIRHENGSLVAQVASERNGTFEADLGSDTLRRVRVSINAPGTQGLDFCAHERDVELTSTPTRLDIDVPAVDFERVGVPTSFRWSVRKLHFSGGQEIELVSNSLTLIVGANNSGKTRALRDIETSCSWQLRTQRAVVTSLEAEPDKPAQWIISNWLRDAYPLRNNGGSEVVEFGPAAIQPDSVGHFAEVSTFLVYLLDIEKRHQFSKPHPMHPIAAAPANMIDHVIRNDVICERLSLEIMQAFNIGLLPEIGPNVGFRIGIRSQLPNSEDRGSGVYRRALAELPTLDAAGDGIRSYVGTLIGIAACPHPILLIDEPEAFLHPPQARHLGKLLAEASRDRQLVVATHSTDIVLGALDARALENTPPPSVQIIRLRRDGDLNHATTLSSAAVSALARDPQWESTDLLQAMFHIGAILCEADADRRFYRWLANDPNIAFISCGGKGGVAKAADALRHLGVPLSAIVDFDILSCEGELRAIIMAMGHDWAALLGKDSNYADIRAQLGSGREKSEDVLRTELHDALGDPMLDRKQLLHRVVNVVQSAKAGYEAKRYGIDKLSGGAFRQCDALLERLASIGIFVVRNGELEGWRRAGPAEKGEWIAEAWEILRQEPDAFPEARRFAESVKGYIHRSVSG